MLTAYIDESGIDQGGWMFVAGFVGDEWGWRLAAREWKRAIHPKQHLHLKELRLKERHRSMLAKAGMVPSRCSLIPIFGGVRFTDYADLVKGTESERLMAGYIVCCFALIINTLRGIPKNETLELIFEQQTVHGENLSIALAALQPISNAEMCLEDGTPKLANWRSVPKKSTPLTEIADYYAYALFQHWKDKTSLKANLCSPILRSGSGEALGAIMDRAQIRQAITEGRLLLMIQEAERVRKSRYGEG